MINYLILLVMTILGAIASFFLKKASGVRGLKNLFLCIYFYLGGGLYFISALLNIYLLKIMDYSVVLPLTSITYIWTMIISHFILKEKMGYKKMIGMSFVFIGLFLIAQ